MIEKRVVPRAHRVFKVGDLYEEDGIHYKMVAVQAHTIHLKRVNKISSLLFTIKARLALACTYLMWNKTTKTKHKQ